MEALALAEGESEADGETEPAASPSASHWYSRATVSMSFQESLKLLPENAPSASDWSAAAGE